MRTTITLEDDVTALLGKHMRERRLSFKDAVNSLLRAALTGGGIRPEVTFPVYDMGDPFIDLTHALRHAQELEDDERQRDLGVGR